MKSCFKFFVLFYCLDFINGSFRCDYKYSSKAQAWFKFAVVPANWFDARLRCLLEGAVLASPTTPEILTEMRNIMNRSNPEYEIFTGIHATVSQGDYYTIEGTPLSKIPVSWAESQTLVEAGYSKFSSGQPNNVAPGQSCGGIYRSSLLVDIFCDRPATFICEKSPGFPFVCRA
ncbi:hypothetical protein PYW08_009543 [Mythimna loreyi]|uniref:Uncharacterized protein n=1 Tax=Mythimna loreyi TaxID=667449 RepID=A0ACC2Q6B9_9NEOP|nr:hypothetical protein PYW08_009543 [Mythimna loreyi]